MWSCPENMPKCYPGLRDILPDPTAQIQRVLDKTLQTGQVKSRFIQKGKKSNFYNLLKNSKKT